MRVLFVGDNWFGSCPRACSSALRRLGCDVLDLDDQTFFPQWTNVNLKVARRLLSGWITADFNTQLLKAAADHKPDFLLAFKGTFIAPATLRTLRTRGLKLYNYYPDRIVFVRGTELEKTFTEYDCLFDTKRSWDGDMKERIRVRERIFLPHGYDPEVHVPTTLSESDRRLFSSDVCFVGTYTSRKERLLDRLVQLVPEISLRIYGNDWARSSSARLRPHIVGRAVQGQSYAKVIAASKINLAIMGVSDAVLDETTVRTFEIPACGGFMLHERSEEVLGLYQEGSEIALFSSPEELAHQVRFYLANPDLAGCIAEAGRRRAVPHYSYDRRMQAVLDHHRSCVERDSCADIAC